MPAASAARASAAAPSGVACGMVLAAKIPTFIADLPLV
jgi:hypothetical protein